MLISHMAAIIVKFTAHIKNFCKWWASGSHSCMESVASIDIKGIVIMVIGVPFNFSHGINLQGKIFWSFGLISQPFGKHLITQHKWRCITGTAYGYVYEELIIWLWYGLPHRANNGDLITWV